MGYDQTLSLIAVAVEPTFVVFPIVLENIRSWPLMPFFQNSLKNSDLKTAHNTFRDCRVHFFRQPFSK